MKQRKASLGLQKKSGEGTAKEHVPPRLVPVHYDEAEAEREEKRLERAKRRALSSSVIRELKEQYSDAPEKSEMIGILKLLARVRRISTGVPLRRARWCVQASASGRKDGERSKCHELAASSPQALR